MVREELEKYDGGFTDEMNDQRKKNAEVLGYKLSGKSDIKEAVKDPKLKVGQKIRHKNDPRKVYTLKKITHGNRGIPEDPAGTSYMFVASGNRKEYHTKKTWAQAIKKGWIIKESVNEAKSRLQSLRDWGKLSDRERSDKIHKWFPKKSRLQALKTWGKLSDRERSDYIVKIMNESVNEGFTKYHIRLTDTPGWYGVWDKKGKQKFEGDKRFVMKHLKKLKTRMGNFQLKSLIDVATKRKGKDITFDVVESVIKEAGMGILTTDQADVLQGIVLRNKNKNLKAILKIVLKDPMFKGVDKKELLGYIDGARQFVKYMKSHPMESVKEDRDYKAEYEKYGSSTKAKNTELS